MNSALVRELMDGQPVAPEKLRRLLYSDVNALASCAEAVDLEADYLIEAMLEMLREDLLSDSVIGQRVRDYWLEIQHVPGGVAMEVVVRAAEF